MKIKTPAKINTLLHILGKRSDGMHELYMHMVPINLFDNIEIVGNSGKGIRLNIVGMEQLETAENNLVYQAALQFEHCANMSVHQDFTLEKQIPVGAGLGGGSGNAAGVLMALNRIYGHPLKFSQVYELAQSLGADVPFFLKPQAYEVKGIGDLLKPMSDYPKLELLVIKPAFSISTGEAYQYCKPTPLPKWIRALQSTLEVPISPRLHNQFETSLFLQYPELQSIKESLLAHGAKGALVSGSGSAVFGVFEDQEQKLDAMESLKPSYPQIFSCRSVYQYHYFS